MAEFRGFALADPLAPIIFVNGRDAKSAQAFTLLHEMCHLALAQTGVSNAPGDEEPRTKMEGLCNSAAAEFLVPKGYLAAAWGRGPGTPHDKAEAIARDCKVSLIVVARKARDDGIVGEDEFLGLCRRYKGGLGEGRRRGGKGGNYYLGKQYRLRVRVLRRRALGGQLRLPEPPRRLRPHRPERPELPEVLRRGGVVGALPA